MESVIDLGGSRLEGTLKQALLKTLIGKDDKDRHFLGDTFFSDDEGLSIWKKINSLSSYYQTDHEIELLKRHGEEIMKTIAEGTAIIDLGCG